MPSSVAIVAFGTRGDTQPYVELGRGLAERGHKVRIACNFVYKKLVDEAGLECVPLDVDPGASLRTQDGQDMLSSGRDMAGLTDAIVKILGPGAAQSFGLMAQACEDVDAIIATPPGLVPYSVAEKRGVPYLIARTDAVYPTRAFPHWAISRSFGPMNKLTYPMTERVLWRGLRDMINGFRANALDLPPLPAAGPFGKMRAEGVHTIFNFSPSVLPPPRDWPAQAHVTGWWFTDTGADWTPPADLAAFLDAGDKPVYVSMGSESTGQDQQRLQALVRGALAKAGVRGILLGDPAELASDENLFVLNEAPYDWLMPRLSSVVHHAGTNTIGTVLRAGLPSVACPVFSDQPAWANRLHRLGAAPAPLPLKEITVDKLADAIAATQTDQRMRDRAAEIGRKVSAEDGVATACDVVEKWLAGNPAVPRPVKV